jgi:hypothetical protein
MSTDVQQHMEDTGKGSIALGAGMMLIGVLLGCIWAWLTFFRRSKSPRNGMTGSSGQVSKHNFQLIRQSTFDYITTGSHPLSGALSFLYLMYALLRGKMLGGLNPSTDLLVGSTSQYGPVLTEVPSQLKMKQASSHDTPAVPLSDQEEETHTLMQDSASPPSISIGSGTIANQIPG